MEKEEIMESNKEDAATQAVTIGVSNLAVGNGNGSSASPARCAVPHQLDDQLPTGSGNASAQPGQGIIMNGDEADKPVAYRRLSRELAQLSIMSPEGCQVKPVDGDLFKWEGTIAGPKGTPYEEGIFKISLHFPSKYPFAPPQVSFLSKIYHCNISVEGKVYHEALDKIWTPVTPVYRILLLLQDLLAHPIIEDPVNSTIAQLYKLNRMLHDVNARVWTIRYAYPKPKPKLN